MPSVLKTEGAQVLEALALDEEPGDPDEDETLPDPMFIGSAEQLIQAFRDAAFVAGSATPKRKAPPAEEVRSMARVRGDAVLLVRAITHSTTHL